MLLDAWVGHRPQGIAPNLPRPVMFEPEPRDAASSYHPPTMSSPPELPSHVRAIVDEIENEIGEVPGEAERLIQGAGRHEGNGRVEAAVRQILVEIGEDPERQGLQGTPERVHRMYTELTAGYHVDPERLINGAIFDVPYSEMVIVKDIPFYSLCEHHLLPFFGTAAVASVLGLFRTRDRTRAEFLDHLARRPPEA
jgi:hypothetical protein